MDRVSDPRPRVIAAACTFHRNGPLESLLLRLAAHGERDHSSYSLGVVVVDDSADQLARPVVEQFADRFELGATYVHSGKRNISIARNRLIETAAERGDWIAMTDDDCEPSDHWIASFLAVQAATGADVVTGTLYRRAPENAPAWIRTQPFLDRDRFDTDDMARMDVAFTNNCFLRAAMIRKNPELRFRQDFGRIGGEDTVFFDQVARSGADMRFAKNAVMYENEDEERLTLGYQMRRFFWYGNTSVLTSLQRGKTRPRMAIHALATIARAAVSPLQRLAKGDRPQLLYAAANVLEGFGKLAAVGGLKVKHK